MQLAAAGRTHSKSSLGLPLVLLQLSVVSSLSLSLSLSLSSFSFLCGFPPELPDKLTMCRRKERRQRETGLKDERTFGGRKKYVASRDNDIFAAPKLSLD